MIGSGHWAIYSGTGKIVLFVVLAAAATAVAYLGIKLPLPVRPPRPGRPAAILMIAVWVLAIVALVVAVGVYEKQALRAGFQKTTSSNPVTPVTLIGVCVVFFVVLFACKARGWHVALGSAVIGALAAPWIFEVPFDLIILPRTHPVIDPGLYRLVLFAPLILTGIMTVALVSLSPAVRVHRATLWCLAGMLALYAAWGLFGFGYPSAPGPITLNVLSKIVALITALTLFLPPRARHEASDPAQAAAASSPQADVM
jgi:hypothetical protein